MAGIDIPIPELQLTIHPPSIKDIAYMGEKEFFNAAQYICLNKEQLVQDETLLQSYSNFQVLMKVLEQSKDKEKKIQLQTLFLLLFPQYQTVILPSGFLLNGQNNKSIILDENNFDLFQSYVKEILCMSNIFQKENVIYNPANEAAKKIAEKIYAGRRKVAEIQNNQNKGTSILSRYLSILEVAKIVSPKEGPELNLFQLFSLMERYMAYLEQDMDNKIRLAGGTVEKPAENWMRDLHQNN